ncbi:hypothetical protein GCM10022225_83220 [Plantactinospora mayteni]|uniref:YcaO domain-containing protein n=2 Tax=Plantactinospora mayteni TaxID=566021 RepID=A0ABQ4F4H4_9ACTN|nr:hypothetical protein Pma05_83760 [Plantactinospora mayteni]
MAAHTGSAQATRIAWYELLERDAFMRVWLSKLPPKQLIASDPLPEQRLLTAALQRQGWTIVLLDLGANGRPIVGAAAVRGQHFAFGAAADPDPAVAAEKAVREAWSVTRAPVCERASISAVRTPADHRRYYMSGQGHRDVSWLLQSDAQADLSELSIGLPEPSRDVIVYEWPAKITRPFRVVRVLDPAMIPITFGYGREPLGRSDVQRLVASTGASLDEPMPPHPFP